MAKICTTLVLIFFFAAIHAQSLPVHPNNTDSQHRRQGEWCLWMDGRWQPTHDSVNAAFYRIITYKDDKPTGIVKDFFRNGQVQFEGTLLEDKPAEVLDGKCKWYYHTGEVRVTESFKNGETNGDQKVMLRSGKSADENWSEYYKLGWVLQDQQKYGEAADAFERALEHAEALTGRENEVYEDIAYWLGLDYQLSDNKNKAIYYHEEFIAVRKLIRKQPDTLMLSALSTLGTIYKLQNNWPMAKSKLKEFITLNSLYFDNGHPDYAETIQTLGSACEALHEYDDALAYLLEAGKLFNAAADTDKYEYPMLSNIFSLAGLYFSMGEMTKGEQFLTGKIKMLKANYGAKSEYYITALGLLARLHYGAGQLKLTEQELLEQLNLIKQVNGEQSEEYASTLGSLAELNVVIGDIPKADQYIQQGRKIFEAASHENVYYLLFLEKLTTVYGLMGNKPGMQQTIQKRRELTIKLFGKSSIQYAQVLMAMAQQVFFDKKWEESVTLAKEGISIFSKYEFDVLDDKQHQTIALLHQILSTSYMMLYNPDQPNDKLKLARYHAEESIGLFESQSFQATNAMINDSYLAMALICTMEQDKKKADHYYNLVLNNVKKEVGENNFQFIQILFMIANKSQYQKDFKQSLSYYQKAIAQLRYYVLHVFPYLSEQEKEQFYAGNKYVLQNFYGFAAQYHEQVPGLTEIWLNLVIEQKGIILQSFAPIREAIFNSSVKEMQRVFNTWQISKNDYAKLLQNLQADKSEIAVLAEKLNELEKKLSAYAINSNLKFKFDNYNWKEIQKSLGPNEAAVEIVSSVGDRDDVYEDYDSSYYAIIIKPSGTLPIIVKLKTAKEIEGKPLKYYQNAIRQQLEDEISYNTFWKPLEKQLQGVKKVWLSADGAYHQINPSTLFNPETKRYLQEDISIQLVPSTALILKQKKKPSLSKVTIFAHPDYGSVSHNSKSELTRSLDLDNISDLPGTEKELDEIVALFKQNKIAYQDFEGSKASEDEIKSISMPQVLHIATHGFFLPSVVISEHPKNPLLRSGLLMAGCQRKPHLQNPEINDGVLTAFEVSTLSLYKTSLVVLSACETGLGDVKNGEGVYGLQRAFLMAGAEQVMMSLWKVDDEATREFMVLFYQGWITLNDIDQAHYYAQNKLRKKYAHPYYWGAFVISGN